MSVEKSNSGLILFFCGIRDDSFLKFQPFLGYKLLIFFLFLSLSTFFFFFSSSLKFVSLPLRWYGTIFNSVVSLQTKYAFSSFTIFIWWWSFTWKAQRILEWRWYFSNVLAFFWLPSFKRVAKIYSLFNNSSGLCQLCTIKNLPMLSMFTVQ